MGWLARLFPGPAILTRLTIYALVFALGGAVGNGWATKRALERELQASADRQRENHLVLFEEFRRRNAEYKAHIEQQIGADAAAYAVLEKGKADAEAAAKQARASLRIALGENQKLTENVDDLKVVNSLLAASPPDPGCVLPVGVRQSINGYIARLNSSPAVGGAQAASAGASQSPPGADQILTCRELANSVIDILQTAGGYIARDESWREWSDKALK